MMLRVGVCLLIVSSLEIEKEREREREREGGGDDRYVGGTITAFNLVSLKQAYLRT